MLAKILIFIITALIFYSLGREEGIKENKEAVKNAIKRSKNISEIKMRLRIKWSLIKKEEDYYK